MNASVNAANTPESGNAMTASVQPSSLASVASATPQRTESTRALGTGLETRGIHAWFGKNHVLSDINLDFTAGSVTALIGPSGCGKSTFIRTINRMHEFIPGAAMAGEVLLDGKDVYAPGVDVTKIRLQIGMVFQKPNPFPSMTIGENVLSGLKLAQLKVENKDDLLEECLVRAGQASKVQLEGLKDDRRAVIGGGLSILYTLATQFGIAALLPARGALRQGVIFDLDERLNAGQQPNDGEDVRDSSVRELQQRFLVDEAQAQRVGQVAEALYNNVQPDAGRDARRELQWACALHEIGMMVSHHDHHRHSAYMLGNVDAPGFSQSQQRRLAELVLAQRGGLRKVEASLMHPDFAWQAMCLHSRGVGLRLRCQFHRVQDPIYQSALDSGNRNKSDGSSEVRLGRTVRRTRPSSLAATIVSELNSDSPCHTFSEQSPNDRDLTYDRE